MNQKLKPHFWQWSLSIIAIVTSLNLFQPVVFADTLPSPKPTNNSSVPSVSASEMFRKAYENRYSWDSDFPGYTATVAVKLDKEEYKGQVRIKPDLSIEVTGIDNKDASQAVKDQLTMIAIHRRKVPFAVAHKGNRFKFGSTDKNGFVEIFQEGKVKARYKVSENQLMQVNRLLGDTAVTVDVQDSEQTPKGYLATKYKTTFYDSQYKAAMGTQEDEDSYKEIAGYYLLTRKAVRQIDEKGQETASEMNFTNISLLR
jgi:isocitrate dehydrogenase